MEPRRDSKRRWKLAVVITFLVLVVAVTGAVYLFPKLFPDTRLAGLVGAKKAAQAQEIYYCPMHPDYKSNKPGTCPICNMTLVKLEPEGQAPAHEHKPTAPIGPTKERKILYWQDAMNPAYRSVKPGKAPDGMDLVPVYADESPSAEALPPGTVKISSERQQLIGVQFGQVSRQTLSRTIRTVGRVTYDETRVTRVQAKVSGWIDRVYVDFTGSLVTRGQPLFSLYSPELLSTQQEFLLASRAKDHLADSSVKEIAANAAALYDSSRERLRLWDISDEQIQDLERRGTPTKTLTLYSPITGFVVTRNAFPGQRVTPEAELYVIADLRTLWVLADVYEYEVPFVRLGQAATMTLTYLPGKTFAGKVTYIYPQLDNATRTLKVRLEFPNRRDELKPDMYANVDLRIDYGEHLAVPQEAVLDSGTEQLVFVAREDGYFEPRKVKLGPKVGNLYVVLAGVKAGEQVVTSANFLIDSESQLKSALGAMTGGHAAHGGGAPAGSPEKLTSPEPKAAQPGGQTDHSQHQTPPSPPQMQEMPGRDHSKHGQ